MSSNKKTTSGGRNVLRIILSANYGCGCGRPKPSEVHEPRPKPKTSPAVTWSSTTSEGETEAKMMDMHMQSPMLMNSVAVEKESDDPYKDFRHSMLQMIFEKEVYSQQDLDELLRCFLQLNSPSHHHLILNVFHDICHQAFQFPHN